MDEFLKNSDKPKTPTNSQGLDKTYNNETQELTVLAARQKHQPKVKERPEHTAETVKKPDMEKKCEQRETFQMINYANASSNFAAVKIAVASESHFKTNNAHDSGLVEAQNQEKYESMKQHKQPYLISEESEPFTATNIDYNSYGHIKHNVQNSTNSRSDSLVSKETESKLSSSKASSLTNHKIEKMPFSPKGYGLPLRKVSRSSVYTQSDLMSYDGSISPYRQIMHIPSSSIASSEVNSPVSSRGLKRELITRMQLQNMVNRMLEKEPKILEMKLTSDSPKRKKRKKKRKRNSKMSLNQDTTPQEPIFTSQKQAILSPKQSIQPDDKICSEVNHYKLYHDPLLKNTVDNLETACTKVCDTETTNGIYQNDRNSQFYTKMDDAKTANGICHNDGHSHEHNDLVNEFDQICNVKLSNQQKLLNLVPNKTLDSVIDHYSEHHMKLNPKWRKHAPNETNHFKANVKMTNIQDAHVHFEVTSDECANGRKPLSYAQHEKKKSVQSHQGKSKSHKRKRSASKERKLKHTTGTGSKLRKDTTTRKSEGHLRLPDIDKNDKTVLRAKSTPLVQHTQIIDFDEMETETLSSVTPSEKQGATKWKDLVQKYMRETSPVVGKKEDRLVLQTTLDSDTDESVSDIFERAIRKYALDLDDDYDDSD